MSDSSQVQGGRDMVQQTPGPGEVVIDVQTTQALAGVGRPLGLPGIEGLLPEQHHQFWELIQCWAGVFAAHQDKAIRGCCGEILGGILLPVT